MDRAPLTFWTILGLSPLPFPRLRIGKLGTKIFLDPDLSEKEGSVSLEINDYLQVMRELESRLITPGKIRSKPMKVQACWFWISLHTGEILALASQSSFDPHLFVNGTLTNFWNELQTNPYKRLLNKAINGLYVLGSTIKMDIALAVLEKGVIDFQWGRY